MNTPQNVFKRYEEKFMLNEAQHKALMKNLGQHTTADSYGRHTISNLYFDTDNWELIRHSIEKPIYKEKLRLRCYGIPTPSDPVFIELKKKYDGIVYKRRAALPLKDASGYLTRSEPLNETGQILREINWFMKRYHPEPKVLIAYERLALFGNGDPNLRLTFDTDIRFRETVLDLSKGHWGQPLLPKGQILMEIKIPGAMPIWLGRILNELQLYPVSFSKYGQIYKTYLKYSNDQKGGIHCA